MTEAKYVGSSLTTILEDPIVKCILNRSCDITTPSQLVTAWWDYNLMKRKPSAAMDEYGFFKGTDLDLACFMYALAGRGAVINIPTYTGHSVKKQRTDQEVKSAFNRHGELLKVGANKTFFSFNITIMDQNVIGEDKVGDYRTFSLTGKDGGWYKGWRSIQFEPTLKENRFITENRLWTGNKIVFKNFIHPNRWTSFFGRHWVITKLMIERLEDEAAFLNTEVKRMLAAGVKFPEGEGSKSYSYGESGAKVSKSFDAFESKVYIPKTQIEGDYSLYEDMNQELLLKAYSTRKEMNRVIGKLRFMTRASEYAHTQNPDRMPHWLKNVKWESDFVEPGKRTKWDRLKLFQPKVGELSVSILKRSFTKSVQVSAD